MQKHELESNEQATGKRGISPTAVLTRKRYDPLEHPMSLRNFFGTSRIAANPFSLLGKMSEEMERVLSGLPTAQPDGGAAFWVPAIEVTENNGACVIRAELPGLKTEDVKVEVADGVLTLEGERKVEHEAEHGGVYRTERMYGRFYRRIPLPDGAKVDRAQAKFDNGVLEISVPVAHDNRRQIPVRTTADNGAVKQQA